MLTQAWEYDFDEGVPAPLDAMVEWVCALPSQGESGWALFLRVRAVGRGRRTSVRFETPAGCRLERSWVFRSLTAPRTSLLVVGHAPDHLRRSFTEADLRGPEEWELPRSVITAIAEVVNANGRAVLIGHDAQYLFTFGEMGWQ